MNRFRDRRCFFSTLFVVSVLLAPSAAVSKGADFPSYIWVEGEDARPHSMRGHGWYDSVTKESLSGGAWLSHFAEGAPPEAEYRLSVPESAEYCFWVRCNPVAGARLSFRIDTGAWKDIDTSRAVGQINIAADGKPDMRFIAWVDAGAVKLARGTCRLRFRFTSSNNNHGAIDCFVLSRRPFRPRGTLKPGERSGRANVGFFAWEPDTDTFGKDALVDLSSLNEDRAGRSGRVRAEGNDFVLGNGRKVRFWAANGGPGLWRLDHAAHTYLAKRLAKTGVNMVRLHGAVYGSRDPAVDRRSLDGLHHLVAAMKEEGIYVSLSFFFPLWFSLDGDQHPFMLLFFDPDMQRLHRGWAEALLTTPNPYTKLPLGRDPAVAIVEIINEDSHFFWTFGKKNMSAARWERFTALYGDWLKKRHGSLAAALEAWGGAPVPGDDPAAGRMELLGAWDMTAQGLRANPKRRKRISDQVRFLTENMRGFYEETVRFFRTACRYDGPVTCSNWHVADPSILDALERYCYTAGDVIDHHGYFDHGHRGEAASWSVRPGHEFTSQSALTLAQPNPLPYVETEGHPHIISEIGWPMPNMYRSEFTFLTAAYGSLQGLDGIYNFAIGGESWDQQIGKFPMNTPAALGCFPAAALVYRRGYVKESPPIVMDNLLLEDLYDLKGTAVYVAGAFDQFRAADIPPGGQKQGAIAGIDPLSFYAGRVVRSFEGDPARSFQRSLDGLVDRDRKTVTSVTGELSLDYGTGVATMNTAKAQGAAGFLGRAGAVKLDTVTIDMKNDYGTVTVVALDDKPIDRSGKILIQAMTIEQFHGFSATGPKSLSGRIESIGAAPIGVEKFAVTVTLALAGKEPRSVTACDEHGYPTDRPVTVTRTGSTVTVTLNDSSPYHVIQR